MNLGRGFSFPQDKDTIQNGNIWIPATPDKPIVQRPIYPQTEKAENWQDLLGMYSVLLQDEPCNGPSQKYIPNTADMAPVCTYNNLSWSLDRTELSKPNREEQSIRTLAPVETYNRLPKHYNSNGLIGMNLREQNIRDASIEKLASLNQNKRSIGSCVQNLDNVVPQKVNSLAELMGMKSALNAPLTNGDPNGSAFVRQKPINSFPHSQAESNPVTYRSAGAMIQSNHNLQDKSGVGSFNLQVPNSRLSVPYRPNYNLNLPPISEAGESSSTAADPFQLGPFTQDQRQKLTNYQIIQRPPVCIDEIPPLCIEETPYQDKDAQGRGVLSQQAEIVEKMPNPIEKDNSGGVDERGIDLNMTPPPKTPKRRKHRPKVIVEGKPKRTPKVPVKENNNTPDGKSTGKRKYVRRKGIETPKNNTPNVENPAVASQIESAVKSCRTTLNFDLENGTEKDNQGRKLDCQEQNNVANRAVASHSESARKSCRRSLNFDLENGIEKDSEGRKLDCHTQNKELSKVPFNLNLGSQNAEWSTEINEPSTSAVKECLNNLYGKEKHQTEKLQPALKNHTLNVIARSLNVRSANINQSSAHNRYDQIHHLGGGFGQIVIQANTNFPNLDKTRQPMLHSKPQLVDNSVNFANKRGSKREYSSTELPQAQNVSMMGSQLWHNEVSKTGHSYSYNSNVWQKDSESIKRNKVADKFNVISSSMTSEVIDVENYPGPTERRRNKSSNVQSSTLCIDGALVKSDIKGRGTSRNPHDWSTHFRLDVQHDMASSQVQHSTKPLAIITDLNQEPRCERDPKFTQGNDIIGSPVRVPAKRQTAGQVSRNRVSRMDKVPRQETKNARGHKHSPKEVIGLSEKNRILFSVDYIMDRMNNLHIDNNYKEIVREEQGALVPYKGESAIVAYEAFDPIKKRRPRPKVDLDPETNRLWNLLMGKEDSESADKVDSDKEKWWEEERKIFRGRVDSFIARMHLVQGDRRFSKWKGSVVDSVIGVFLTQNVSDHLSSSAFMSLVAKFPPKSTTTRQHEVHVTYPDGSTYDHKMTRETVSIHSSVASTESSELMTGNATKGTISNLMNNHTKRTEEDIISSQSSSESFIFQPSEDIRSSSGSTSEAEDHIIGCSLNKNQQAEKVAAFNQHYFQVTGSFSLGNRPSIGNHSLETQVYRQYQGLVSGRNVCSYPLNSSVQNHNSPVHPLSSSYLNMSTGLNKWEEDTLGNDNISAFVSMITSESCAGKGHNYARQEAETTFTAQQTGKPNCQLPMVHQETINNYPAQHTDSPALSKQPSDMRKQSEDVLVEPNKMSQVHSSTGPYSKTGTTTLNTRKRKAEKEKVEPFNWDTLREEVQANVGTRGISKDAMDSLDYEALRNADVRVISDTIKERGMNNMLAERIKDFLDRLVRDHGRTDLEWLRDVQPDKVKDYLLSIRGLGLKSVECVRLLTLHHLAFPVDTNVGRIAVRLGWVPLQPLPESLQLHLLEMYPVLESIQKYLWPRLCKLDQETLYELHYQMITFGKVFCTKREPNCNACPLRAECRHFASAFASARLSLPGPEEKRVVSSAAHPNVKRCPDVNIKPVQLLLADDNLEMQTGPTRNCEPIIEEPSSPEATIEVTERDIEDAFYEDPDEIPVIKLNIEEFTTNLQSFMQEHMEMQEGDMSRALVALSPDLASIPKPKLKHISRLRTEHQVYELPDSHPLLKGLDRREPDDPSPYLLAIWTPGETADSIQAPENKCTSREEGGLCNKTTCFSCSSTREAQAQTVRGTILIPCRTAMRGSFPLNGTYFQVNEMFADHASSLNPIDVPRSYIWNLPRRTVFFGTSVTSIFKGLPTEDIQYCFWRGFVCVRGFDRESRAPRPLKARLHFPASKMTRQNERN